MTTRFTSPPQVYLRSLKEEIICARTGKRYRKCYHNIYIVWFQNRRGNAVCVRVPK